MVIPTTHRFLYVAYKVDDLLVEVIDVKSLTSLFLQVEVPEGSGEIIDVLYSQVRFRELLEGFFPCVELLFELLEDGSSFHPVITLSQLKRAIRVAFKLLGHQIQVCKQRLIHGLGLLQHHIVELTHTNGQTEQLLLSLWVNNRVV